MTQAVPNEVQVAIPSDEELMLAYGRGEVRAFETLYSRHRGPLYRFITRSIKDRSQVDEIFQDTWSRVISARTRYRPDARFTTYIMQIAHNLIVDFYRRARPTVHGEAAERALEQLAAPADERPDRVLSEFEQARRLQTALEILPEDQRSAFLMRMEQGLGVEEIAQATGVGHETAKSRLRYAFARIREKLGS
jgi:RNA polymerase sigma-70 factor (ECF subfamily)